MIIDTCLNVYTNLSWYLSQDFVRKVLCTNKINHLSIGIHDKLNGQCYNIIHIHKRPWIPFKSTMCAGILIVSPRNMALVMGHFSTLGHFVWHVIIASNILHIYTRSLHTFRKCVNITDMYLISWCFSKINHKNWYLDVTRTLCPFLHFPDYGVRVYPRTCTASTRQATKQKKQNKTTIFLIIQRGVFEPPPPPPPPAYALDNMLHKVPQCGEMTLISQH